MDPQYARRSYQRKLDVLKIGVEQLEKIEEEMAELGDSMIELWQASQRESTPDSGPQKLKMRLEGTMVRKK